jgi:2-polyprenyl-6-methoxyphenol hydroxylase-like FAD-dependent oxidoreductase
MSADLDVLVVGAGIGGLTLALELHARGIGCRVFEAAPALKPLGTGISLLPHGTAALARLGLLGPLQRRAVRFRESCFFTGFGQLVFRDPAPEGHPQLLIHRADLHEVLLEAVHERLGRDAVVLGHECTGVGQDGEEVIAVFRDPQSGKRLGSARGRAAVACDGIHSAIRAQLHPDAGGVVFSGITMWRGLTRHPPFLSGGSHCRIGSLRTGKLVVYPIREDGGSGQQLVNWVAEVRRDAGRAASWSKPGRLEDFMSLYADWRFAWLDVPALLRDAQMILEYPMVDRDPVDRWSFGRVALMGDAAHPMLPRGSNGAMQAILDARAIADALAREDDVETGLRAYEDRRLRTVNAIVLANRSVPPDHLIEVVHQRTGDQPFERLHDVIDEAELRALLDRYKALAGYDDHALGTKR